MKQFMMVVAFVIITLAIPAQRAYSQDPVTEAIKQGVIRVIKAIDLQIQRLQTRTIWLQNAQKVVENKMSELQLTEITDWVDKQKKLYQDYFDELSKVKAVIAGFSEVRGIMDKQRQIISEYKQAYSFFKGDSNFTQEEIGYMDKVYTGILAESAKNVDQLFLAVNAFQTQMSDAKRLEIVHKVSGEIEANLVDLRQFNNQNKVIALQHANEKGDINQVRKIYGLSN